MNDSHILKNTKEILIERGWGKGSFGSAYSEEEGHYDPGGTCCLMGAIALAAKEERVFAEEDYEWFDGLDEEYPGIAALMDCVFDSITDEILPEEITSPSELWRFNDKCCKNIDDVLGVIDCAIRKVEKYETA